MKGEPSVDEKYNTDIRMLNDHLGMDCQMTQWRYETRALPKGLVLKTWEGVLKDEETLPKDWTVESGVLVGITGGQFGEEVSGVG